MAAATLKTASGPLSFYPLTAAGAVDRLPRTVKILLENLVRRAGNRDVSGDDVAALAAWPASRPDARLAFMPTRVLMQDFTGVPAVVDLAAIRSAVARAGGDPSQVNPEIPVDLIIDHSVQVDRFGTEDSYRVNLEFEYERNRERYAVLNWAQGAFEGFRVVPPGMGICHQVNLEYLGRVVAVKDGVAMPDTLLGTDSHTPMINGLGVLGWGVGGIEAEAAMLGQPLFLSSPVVVGVRMTGALKAGATATDLVLTLTEMLRNHGVVGKFVEFFGDGLSSMTVADRATLSNMSPEFGATASLFPVDQQTLRYLHLTNRGDIVDLVERYTKEQGLFREDGESEPAFSETLALDLGEVEPSLAGPRRPQDRVALGDVWRSFTEAFSDRLGSPVNSDSLGRMSSEGGPPPAVQPAVPGQHISGAEEIEDGSVVIAAITSCTNTSNPTVMVAAGLLARNAVDAGLQTRPWVKTSLAPGSRVVTQYLESAGLTPYLEKLRFNLVGYGCTTCIGNSGPLPEEIAAKVESEDLTVVSVLSGNRNFEARIHPQVRASYLASPPLVVAFALAGTIDIDLTKDPIGEVNGKPVYLEDLWPSAGEVAATVSSSISPEQFALEYGRIFEGDETWSKMPVPKGTLYDWDPESSYIREPPFFEGMDGQPPSAADILQARVLVVAGDSVTTDHISPAGPIKLDSPAGRYLSEELDVGPRDFNSFGSRRGNHEIMLRGTFGNIRFRNLLAEGTEGPWTLHQPSGDRMTIYDAHLRYKSEGVPLLVIGGKEYGSGSSRDWAAKGTALLGVKGVIAESFERIHRSNLVGMGVLPMQFVPGESAASLGLTGREVFSITGIGEGLSPGKELSVRADDKEFTVIARIDAPVEAEYLRHGGVLSMVLRQISS